MMLHSRNIGRILNESLSPVKISSPYNFTSEPLHSALLISSQNGAIISFATSGDTSNTKADVDNSHSINNLKMMSLLLRDKWAESQQHPETEMECYKCENGAVILCYEIETLHCCLAQIPQSDLLVCAIGSSKYTYGLLKLKLQVILEAFSGINGYTLR